MVKPMLKRIFAIVGSGLAPIAAIMYLILGIQHLIAIEHDITANFYLLFAGALFFGLAFCLILFGAKVLFSFLNKENDEEPFTALVLCFSGILFTLNLVYICFWGGVAANWVMLIFSLGSALTLLIHVSGIQTAWYTDVVGIAIGMITAITAACSSAGLMLAASVIVSVICFLIMAIFALCLIKDAPESTEEKSKE